MACNAMHRDMGLYCAMHVLLPEGDLEAARLLEWDMGEAPLGLVDPLVWCRRPLEAAGRTPGGER